MVGVGRGGGDGLRECGELTNGRTGVLRLGGMGLSGGKNKTNVEDLLV